MSAAELEKESLPPTMSFSSTIPALDAISRDYVPPRMTKVKRAQVMAQRYRGLYLTEETRDEAIVAVRQLKGMTQDKVVTLIRAEGVFNVYNLREFMRNIVVWRTAGVVMRRTNIRQIGCGCEGSAYMFIIQPDDNTDAPICPLAASFGFLVSGYAYIARDPDVVGLAWKALGSK